MNDIEKFISEGGPYQYGLELLKRSLPNHPSLPILELGENAITWPKLKKALSEAPSSSPKAADTKSGYTTASRPRYSKEDVSEWPPQLQKMHSRIKELYRVISQCHGELYDIHFGDRSSDMVRSRGLTIKIIDSHTEIRSLWSEIDYFHFTGNLMSDNEDLTSRMNYWLANQVQYTNYCRQQESAKTTDKPLYKYRKKVLEEIQKHLECIQRKP